MWRLNERTRLTDLAELIPVSARYDAGANCAPSIGRGRSASSCSPPHHLCESLPHHLFALTTALIMGCAASYQSMPPPPPNTHVLAIEREIVHMRAAPGPQVG